MTSRNEYEIVPHNRIRNFRLFLVRMIYRTPHMHRDMEICLLVDGTLTLHTGGRSADLHSGDLFIITPFQVHELKAVSPALILSMQVSSAFFTDYFPQIDAIEPEKSIISASDSSAYLELKDEMMELACCYMKKEKNYELKCAGLINLFFCHLLNSVPWHLLTDRDQAANELRKSRIRDLTSYIDEHYSAKLLLSELAEQEKLSVCYLSHFFRDNFGVSFQEYLNRIRCEKARQLLITTKRNLLDISIDCGFSDVKYLKKSFLKQYGSTPAEYRKLCASLEFSDRPESIPTSQEILTDAQSLRVLQQFYKTQSLSHS